MYFTTILLYKLFYYKNKIYNDWILIFLNLRFTFLENKNNYEKIQQPISIIFLYLFFKFFYFYIEKNIHNGVFKLVKN